MRRNRRIITKYLLLISVLMLMLLLCACRTRLTNNTEVTSTIADEDGYLSSEYQMRRDMIGDPVAERPIFTGWGSDDSDDDYYDSGTDAFDNYDQGTPDEWDEPDDSTTSAPSTNPGTGNSGSSSGSSSSGSSSSSGKSSNKDKQDEDYIMVEFNPNNNKATCSIAAIPAKKGDAYGDHGDLPGGEFPDAELDGYEFLGWFTDKSGGSQVTARDIVTTDKDHTLYAHWKGSAKKNDYDLVFQLDGGKINDSGNDVTVKITDGLYPQLTPPVKPGFHFMGWYLEDGKTKIEPGQECTSNHTLKAHWMGNDEYWPYRYEIASNIESLTGTYIDDDSIMAKEKPPKEGEKPSFRIVKCDGEYSKENADATMLKEAGNYTEAVLVVPANIYDNENSKKLYRLILLRNMYGNDSTITEEEITQAATELGVTLTDPPLYRSNLEATPPAA